jgi:hypothetical protein
MVNGSSSEPPSAVNVHALDGTRCGGAVAAAAAAAAACAHLAAHAEHWTSHLVSLLSHISCPSVLLSPALLLCCVTRLLVIVCENKLLLYDLNTRKPYEVSRAVLDGKAPNCVSFLFRGGRFSPGGQPDPSNLMTSPVLAVGCADGVVRLLHLATLRVRDRGADQFASGHALSGLFVMWYMCGAPPGAVCAPTCMSS